MLPDCSLANDGLSRGALAAVIQHHLLAHTQRGVGDAADSRSLWDTAQNQSQV